MHVYTCIHDECVFLIEKAGRRARKIAGQGEANQQRQERSDCQATAATTDGFIRSTIFFSCVSFMWQPHTLCLLAHFAFVRTLFMCPI